uniref:Ubiquitin-conjugating enzyme E2 J2 n=1 Tax=Ascaris lumbricoides TaxID=6252 RepID=A0A0M3I2S7_ASCLU
MDLCQTDSGSFLKRDRNADGDLMSKRLLSAMWISKVRRILLVTTPQWRIGMVGASVTAVARLKKDYSKLLKDPVPYVLAAPLHSNILEWHYVIRGAPSTPYEGGVYHGKLVFPPDFPFKPPAIYMLTPSGRFQTNTRLCLSISDFHPDTWNPAWTVSTIITGLLSFMNETAPTLGSLTSTDSEKRALAKKSREFNLKVRSFVLLR